MKNKRNDGVLLCHTPLDLLEIDSRSAEAKQGVKLMHRILIVAPIAVRLFENDSSFLQQAFEYQLNLGFPCFHMMHANGEVFKVDEDRNKWFVRHL